MTYFRAIHALDYDRLEPKSDVRFGVTRIRPKAMANAFFSDLLSTISERGRTLLRRGGSTGARQAASPLLQFCQALLLGPGGASGTPIARAGVARSHPPRPAPHPALL